MYWISNINQYHEGDPNPGDVAVPQRPAGFDTWNGTAWTQSAAALKFLAFASAIAAGFDTGLGWLLPLDDAARSLITSGAALITSAILGYQLAGNTAAITAFMASSYTFTDLTNAVQTVTIAQALNINIAYGSYYKTIWSAAQ